MLLNNSRLWWAAGFALSSVGMAVAAPPAKAPMVADGPALLGPSYAVGTMSYTPQDLANYDEVGYALVDGDRPVGGKTATGEAFVPDAITASHKTLPLPSYIEVTALDTGRTILVRVNDRGPMDNDRIIALSPGAAMQLGLTGEEASPVRVRLVTPPEQERAVLRAHGQLAERLETPTMLLKVLRQKLGAVPPSPAAAPQMAAQSAVRLLPKPATGKAPSAQPKTIRPNPAVKGPAPLNKGGYVVQVAALSSRARADEAARRVGATVVQSGTMWRVRMGPYPTQDAAKSGVRAAAAKGFENARIMANDAP